MLHLRYWLQNSKNEKNSVWKQNYSLCFWIWHSIAIYTQNAYENGKKNFPKGWQRKTEQIKENEN